MSTHSPHQAPPDDHRLERLVAESVTPPARGTLGPIRAAIRRLTVRLGRPHALHQQEIANELVTAVRALQSGDQGVQPQINELRAWLQAERNGTAEAAVGLKRLEAQLEELVAKVNDHETTIAALRAQVAALDDRNARHEALTASDVPLDRGSTLDLETFEAGPAGTVVGFRTRRDAPAPAEAEGLYLGFEDFFRGSEELIRDRQRSYLPIVSDHGPVLDVGCGRGEFLELLAERGIDAKGIDIDAAMVARCRERGLDAVEQADGIEYLQRLEGAVGTIFASQVIEHLSFEALQQLLALGLEKLKPGGLLVLETVNPHNPQALKHFWIDPTHRNPLFPEVVIALCYLAGYQSGYIWHPGGSGDPDRDRLTLGDYAVIAQTPG